MPYLNKTIWNVIVVVAILMSSLLFTKTPSVGKMIDSMIWKTYYKIARNLADQDEHDEAIEYFTKVLEINPKSIYAYQLRGASYYETGRYKEAILDFNRALEINPNSPADYYSRAMAWQQLEENSKASDDFKKAVNLAPDVLFLRIARGEFCRKIFDWDCVVNDMTKAIELDPGNGGYYYDVRASAFDMLSKPNAATRDYETVIELGEATVSTYLGIGQIYETSEELEKALTYYRKSLEIAPDFLLAQIFKARVYTQQNEIAMAIETIDLAVKKDPDTIKFLGMEDYRWENLRKDKAYWPLAEKHNLDYLVGYEPPER